MLACQCLFNVCELPEAVAGPTDIHSGFQLFQVTNHVRPAEEVSLFWHNQLVGLQESQMREIVHIPVERKNLFVKLFRYNWKLRPVEAVIISK